MSELIEKLEAKAYWTVADECCDPVRVIDHSDVVAIVRKHMEAKPQRDGHGDIVKHSDLYDSCPTCEARDEDLEILREELKQAVAKPQGITCSRCNGTGYDHRAGFHCRPCKGSGVSAPSSQDNGGANG